MVDSQYRAIRQAGRVLLGLFILWQVVFLSASFFIQVEESLREATAANSPYLTANCADFMKGEDRFHRELKVVQKQSLRRYAQATGQVQNWSLFGPAIAKQLSFCSVELRWDDDRLEPGPWDSSALSPVLLLGISEPADINSFLHYKDFRFRQYETSITPNPPPCDAGFEPTAEVWAERIVSMVQEEREYMAAYLSWRWRGYKRLYSDTPPPTQVILLMHGYGIPSPPGPTPWRLEDFGRQPVARWLPWKSGSAALQRFNPLSGTYESAP